MPYLRFWFKPFFYGRFEHRNGRVVLVAFVVGVKLIGAADIAFISTCIRGALAAESQVRRDLK